MRTLLLLGMVSSWAFGQTPNTLTREETAAGWTLLFDGRTYSGWADPTGRKDPPNTSWSIEDGCLKALAKPGLTEDLFTLEKFTDFELKFAWKISPGGNSGLKYKIQDTVFVTDPPPGRRFEDQVQLNYTTDRLTRAQARQEYVVGFEYQVIDSLSHRDAQRGAKYQAGSLYDMLPAIERAEKPVGEWNEARVVVRGTHVEHWLNGTKVVDGHLDGPEVRAALAKRWGVTSMIYQKLTAPLKGPAAISLQNHGNFAWFRALKIRRIR